MKVVLQRVESACVRIDSQIIGACQQGYCLLVGIESSDTEKELDFMAKKIAHLRICSDEKGKMNRSILDTGGSILCVSQFTLLADCSTGRRPSFLSAGSPEEAKRLFHAFVETLRAYDIGVETGIFGANMQVEIHNDGPVTFLLDSKNSKPNI